MSENISIVGMSHFVPELRVENSFFDELQIGSSSNWIKERTGISARYSVLKKSEILDLSQKKISFHELRKNRNICSMADMAEKPWLQLKQNINKIDHHFKEPDLLISGSSVPDYDIPASACKIASHLGFYQTCAFDVNSACSSFVINLEVSRHLLKSANYKNCAIFNLERYTTRLDFSDKRSCILFGDGGTVSLLEKNSSKERLEIIDVLIASDVSGANHVQIPYGEVFEQNGKVVQKFAITRTCEISHKILEKNKLSIKDINYFVGHQANLRMLQAVVKKMGLEENQHLFNVDQYGNQGAAGAPSVLSHYWKQFKNNDLILVSVVGSGLTWGSALLRYCE